MDSPENKPIPYVTWSTGQLVSWLEGLDDIMELYISEIETKGLTGKWMNSVTPGELQKLGVTKIGHQMLIMDRIRQLQVQYISFDNETLQTVLSRVSRQCVCISAAVISLLSITERQDNRDPEADSAYPGIAYDIQDAASYLLQSILAFMAAVVNAAFWLERPPFLQSGLGLLRQFLLENALICNHYAQSAIASQTNSEFREILVYVDAVRLRVEEFLQDFSDSILLTPCTMEFIQIRKLDNSDFGFNFYTTTNNVHVIMSVQGDSAAFRSGKVNKGDELVEVNDQIVIGWQHHRVAALIKQHPKRITLRLRKRPSHATDFTGLTRRHRVVSPNPTTPSIWTQHTRSGYLSGRTPQRSALSPQLVSETLPNTQDSSDAAVSSSSVVCSALSTAVYSLAASSSSSLSLGPSSLLNDSLLIQSGDVTESSSALRMASSTPATPLMTVRGTVHPNDKKLADSGLCTRHDSGESLGTLSSCSSRPVHIADPYFGKFSSSHSVSLMLPGFFQTHRRAASGDPRLSTTPAPQFGERSARVSPHSPPTRLQALDKRSRNKSGKTNADDNEVSQKSISVSKKLTRKISCRELGLGNCEGWLWLKKSGASLTNRYSKRWCVFKDSVLYYYRTPESDSADGSIPLLGFTVTPSPDSKSGRYSFHIFNDSARYIFASDSEIDRSKWINILGLAAIGLPVEVRGSRIGGFSPGYILGSNVEHSNRSSSTSTPPVPATSPITVVSTEGCAHYSSQSNQGLKSILVSKSPKPTDHVESSMSRSMYETGYESNPSLSMTAPSSLGRSITASWKCVSVPSVNRPTGTSEDSRVESVESISQFNRNTNQPTYISVSLPPKCSTNQPQSDSLVVEHQARPLHSKLSEVSIPSAVLSQPDSTPSSDYGRRHSLSPSPLQYIRKDSTKTSLLRKR